MKEREIVSIVNAPEICLSEDEKAGDALLKFYRALGWNSTTQIVDPCKIRTTKCVFDRLYDVIYEKCTDCVTVGMLMVNSGPSVDDDIPDGKVYLLKDWVEPDTRQQAAPENGEQTA